MIKIISFSAVFFTAAGVAGAQSIPYEFSKSGALFEYLSNTVPITNDWTPWHSSDVFLIPVGFPFPFFEKQFDTLGITGGATLFLGSPEMPGQFSFAGFSNALEDLFWVTPGAGESRSTISYMVSGNPGERILKIEWLHAGFQSGSAADYIDFQIWLYEKSGKIEVHFGPQNITSSEVFDGADCTGPIIGLANEIAGDQVVLYGSAQNPSFGYPPFGFKGMEGAPDNETVLVFQPWAAGAIPKVNNPVSLQHDMQQHKIVLGNAAGVQQVSVIDFSGKIVMNQAVSAISQYVELPYPAWPAGIYLVAIWQRNAMIATQKIWINK